MDSITLNPMSDREHRDLKILIRFRLKSDLSDRPGGPAIPEDIARLPPENTPPTGPQIEVLKKKALLGKYVRFMPVVMAYAGLSKMSGTKVGCIILSNDFITLAEGWNGAPRGCDADVDARNVNRDSRLTWVCHAESNAIAAAARHGHALNGATLIVSLMPCMVCAKIIVQAGIVRVVCPAPTDARWKNDFDNARALFTECHVDLLYYDTFGNEE